MPLLLEKDGFQFYFKKGEPLIPYKKPHIHIRGHGGRIQFFLPDGKIKKDNKGMPKQKVQEALKITKVNGKEWLKEWERIKNQDKK